jgi:hypothetical protein
MSNLSSKSSISGGIFAGAFQSNVLSHECKVFRVRSL